MEHKWSNPRAFSERDGKNLYSVQEADCDCGATLRGRSSYGPKEARSSFYSVFKAHVNREKKKNADS